VDHARPYIEILSFLAVPLLTILAYRRWITNLRVQLPRWRSTVGISSIILVSANWLFGVLLLLLLLINNHWTNFFDDAWLGDLILSGLAAALLAVALKGTARFYCVAAGLLMAAFWFTSIVE
jgi:hypothetical protein